MCIGQSTPGGGAEPSATPLISREHRAHDASAQAASRSAWEPLCATCAGTYGVRTALIASPDDVAARGGHPGRAPGPAAGHHHPRHRVPRLVAALRERFGERPLGRGNSVGPSYCATCAGTYGMRTARGQRRRESRPCHSLSGGGGFRFVDPDKDVVSSGHRASTTIRTRGPRTATPRRSRAEQCRHANGLPRIEQAARRTWSHLDPRRFEHVTGVPGSRHELDTERRHGGPHRRSHDPLHGPNPGLG